MSCPDAGPCENQWPGPHDLILPSVWTWFPLKGHQPTHSRPGVRGAQGCGLNWGTSCFGPAGVLTAAMEASRMFSSVSRALSVRQVEGALDPTLTETTMVKELCCTRCGRRSCPRGLTAACVLAGRVSCCVPRARGSPAGPNTCAFLVSEAASLSGESELVCSSYSVCVCTCTCVHQCARVRSCARVCGAVRVRVYETACVELGMCTCVCGRVRCVLLCACGGVCACGSVRVHVCAGVCVHV